MCAKEEHAAVLIENVLRAVAMMHIPIDDQRSAHAQTFPRKPSRKRHIVEDAKPHSPDRIRVMARRTY